MSGHVDSTAEEIGTDLVPSDAPAASLFRTDDPLEVIEKATRIADALKKVLVDKKMIQPIQGKDHVKVEGWITLGAMLGVVPVVIWSRALPNTKRPYERTEGYGDKQRTVKGSGSDWEARVEARTLDGRIVGAAEALCTRDEPRWSAADDYAVKSMAQTRATSKALGGPLRFIVTLAGYEGTPAEEMPREGFSNRGGGGSPSEKQVKYLGTLIKQKKPSEDQLRVMLAAGGVEGVAFVEGWAKGLTGGQVSGLIDWLKERPLPDVERPSDVPYGEGDFQHPPVQAGDDLPFKEEAA